MSCTETGTCMCTFTGCNHMSLTHWPVYQHKLTWEQYPRLYTPVRKVQVAGQVQGAGSLHELHQGGPVHVEVEGQLLRGFHNATGPGVPQ